ncbi:Uncharacterized protein GBIM_04706 [Gryllus bimaculatus]|nr:Uncharacterized protein GBIM_04706 [Gryllus bimaculatus]
MKPMIGGPGHGALRARGPYVGLRGRGGALAPPSHRGQWNGDGEAPANPPLATTLSPGSMAAGGAGGGGGGGGGGSGGSGGGGGGGGGTSHAAGHSHGHRRQESMYAMTGLYSETASVDDDLGDSNATVTTTVSGAGAGPTTSGACCHEAAGIKCHSRNPSSGIMDR